MINNLVFVKRLICQLLKLLTQNFKDKSEWKKLTVLSRQACATYTKESESLYALLNGCRADEFLLSMFEP
jgi:hypothetical protein